MAPAEPRVAKLVLADPRAFASQPVSHLADRAHVSKPAVVRFCRSVGYDGLTDFKRKLPGSWSEGVPFIGRCPSTNRTDYLLRTGQLISSGQRPDQQFAVNTAMP